MQRQSENTSRARAYPVSDARRNSLGPARSMRRGKRMKTRAYPVSDAQCNRIRPVINTRRCKQSLRIASLNIGTMTGKSRELADLMKTRRIDVMCLQETRWGGNKARELGDGCKLFYSGGKKARNGVGICVRDHQDKVLEVCRTSDRVMAVKIVLSDNVWTIVSAYAPQVGCDEDTKNAFWNELEAVIMKVPHKEKLVLAGDLNGHVGESQIGFERWHGGFSVGERNEEGEKILHLAQAFDLAIVNTFYSKRREHLLTYKSGGKATVIDYIMVRRENLRELKNCKVIPGESVATQHRMLVMEMKAVRKRMSPRERTKRTRWWKLNQEELKDAFISKAREHLCSLEAEGKETNWKETYSRIMQLAKEELGESTPGKYLEKESWWWNDAVQQAVSKKRRLFREWQRTREENDQKRYKEANKECKRVVAIAKENAYSQLYEELKGKEGRKKIYKLANARKRMATDIGRVTAVKDKDGTLLTGDDEVKGRWLGYFDDLLNIENEREDLEGILPVQGPIEEIYLEEVITQMGKMKKNKACGPDCLPIEVAKALGDEGAIWMTGVLNEAMRKGIPEEWRTSTITPIYKQKGDPLECNNFRGIKLLSHTLKLWERVVESRLRKMVNISERQYGFQPGKSTIQPLFCLRMLQEKHREFGKELHAVFVDLEKAYDRVPRELIWYSLRRKGVPEAYINIIRDMYAGCKTSVMTSAGKTKGIEIEVGLHQGSALSPLLFVIIIDVITEEIEEGTPWAMLFADDLVLCDPDRQMMELRLERWRECMEKNGLKGDLKFFPRP